jgi:hypothetical protein
MISGLWARLLYLMIISGSGSNLANMSLGIIIAIGADCLSRIRESNRLSRMDGLIELVEYMSFLLKRALSYR